MAGLSDTYKGISLDRTQYPYDRYAQDFLQFQFPHTTRGTQTDTRALYLLLVYIYMDFYIYSNIVWTLICTISIRAHMMHPESHADFVYNLAKYPFIILVMYLLTVTLLGSQKRFLSSLASHTANIHPQITIQSCWVSDCGVLVCFCCLASNNRRPRVIDRS